MPRTGRTAIQAMAMNTKVQTAPMMVQAKPKMAPTPLPRNGSTLSKVGTTANSMRKPAMMSSSRMRRTIQVRVLLPCFMFSNICSADTSPIATDDTFLPFFRSTYCSKVSPLTLAINEICWLLGT